MATILSLSCHLDSLLHLSPLSVICLSSIVCHLMLSHRQTHAREENAQCQQRRAPSNRPSKTKSPLNMLILITHHLERRLLFINSSMFTDPLHTRYSFLQINIPRKAIKDVIYSHLHVLTFAVTTALPRQIGDLFVFPSH